MPNYETLDGFKKKLKSGHYDNVTGARRAIGKMRTWEEKDKDAGRRAVDKHFGAAPAVVAPAKKKAAKKTQAAPVAPVAPAASKRKLQRKKKASKKSAAKASVKSAPPKKAPVKKATAKPAAAPKATAKPGRSSKARTSRPPKESKESSEVGLLERRVSLYGNTIDLYENAAEILCKSAKGSDTGLNVSAGLETIHTSVEQLLQGMHSQIVQPLTAAEQRSSELFNIVTPQAGAVPPPRGVDTPVGSNGITAPQVPAVVGVVPPSV